MSLISITGMPGVGKSFLAKQLSSFLSSPVILEGEEGSIPNWVFEDVLSKKSSVRRWNYFLDKQNLTFKRGEKISNSGITCFIDANPLMMKSLIRTEPKEFRKDLEEVFSNLCPVKIDLTILLITSREKLENLVKLRSRKNEENLELFVGRSLLVQKNLIDNSKKRKNIIVVDRTNLDFKDEDTLKIIVEKIKQWL